MSLRTVLALAVFLAAGAARAEPVKAEHVEAELVAESTAWLPGSTQWVALRLAPEKGWHTYWRNPGDSGLPTTLQWTLPEGFKAGEIHWPYPAPEPLGDLTNYGYGDETLHLVPIEVPKKIPADSAMIRAKAKWLVCKDICIPGSADLALTLPVATIATSDPVWTPRFAEARERIPAGPPLAATFQVIDGEVRLQVEAPALATDTRAEFFAFANDLVSHGAPQRAALEPGRVRFAQAQSAFIPGIPATVEGVLVLHGSASRAFEVKAVPGEVPTVAGGASAPTAAAGAAPTEAPPAQLPPPTLLVVLGFALIGGLILNLMPCVFPVLAIKAVSVIESRRGDAAAERKHALAYTAGVVASCVAAALALVLLRSGGELLGWGFQLQSPVFVALLAYLMLALGLSMSGLVQFGTSLMGVGQGLAERGGYGGSFFTGVLAVVVASPCTAPFMGVALGYALAQPALVAVLVFATLGIGLALPFLLIGFFPALGNLLPRPGAWMETFKQAMAFPLYLTVAWLLWVLGRQAGVDGIGLALAGLVLAAFALWAWSRAHRILAALALAAALGILALPAIRSPAPANAPRVAEAGTEPYSDARLAELRAQQRAVFVNFTADWCISCKVNEKVALNTETVKGAFAARNVAWLVADWTNPDPEITAALGRFGRSGVPLYVLYPPGGEGIVLPQVLTPDIVLQHLESLPSGD